MKRDIGLPLRRLGRRWVASTCPCLPGTVAICWNTDRETGAPAVHVVPVLLWAVIEYEAEGDGEIGQTIVGVRAGVGLTEFFDLDRDARVLGYEPDEAQFEASRAAYLEMAREAREEDEREFLASVEEEKRKLASRGAKRG